MPRPTPQYDSLPWLLWLWFALALFFLARPPLLLFWEYTLHPAAEKEAGRVAETMRLPGVPASLDKVWPGASGRAAEGRLSPLEQGIFEASNHEREALVKPKLGMNAELAQVAAYHSRQMRDDGFFARTAPDGAGPADRAGKALRWTFGAVAENIAKLTDRDELAKAFVEGWMNSPGQRRNLLDGGSTDLGVGCAEPAANDAQAWLHCTQLFMAVWANLKQPMPDSVAAGSAVEVELVPENGKPLPTQLRQTDVRTSAVVADIPLQAHNGGAAGHWEVRGPAGVYRLEIGVPDPVSAGRVVIVPGPYVTVSP